MRTTQYVLLLLAAISCNFSCAMKRRAPGSAGSGPNAAKKLKTHGINAINDGNIDNKVAQEVFGFLDGIDFNDETAPDIEYALQYVVRSGTVKGLNPDMQQEFLRAMINPTNADDTKVRATQVLDCVRKIKAPMLKQRFQLLKGLKKTPLRFEGLSKIRKRIAWFNNPFVHGIPSECDYCPGDDWFKSHRDIKTFPKEFYSNRRIMIRAVEFGHVPYICEKVSEALTNDREFALAACAQDSDALLYFSETLQGYREVVLTAVKQHGSAIRYASSVFFADHEIMLAVVANGGERYFGYATDELKSDPEFMVAVVKACAEGINDYCNEHDDGDILFGDASDNVRANREVVLKVLALDPRSYSVISDELRADREVALLALRNCSNYDYCYVYEIFRDVPDNLRSDREFILTAVQINGRALQYASVGLRADPEIVFAAVTQHGRALEYASEGLRADPEIVFAAVTKHAHALEYVSEDLKASENDENKKFYREIVLAAVTQDGRALKYASEDLRADREIVLTAIKTSKESGNVFQYASPALKANDEFVLDVIKHDVTAFQYISMNLAKNRNFVLFAIKSTNQIFEGILPYIKHISHWTNQDFVLNAIERDARAFHYAAQQFKYNHDFILNAIKRNVYVIRFLSDRREYREYVLAAVTQDGRALKYASAELKADREFVLAAVQRNCRALEHVSEDFRADREIVLAAAQNKLNCFSTQKLRQFVGITLR